MKSLLIILAILAMASTLNAATLKWDASTGEVVGYTVYYTDGLTEYNRTVGDTTEILNMESYFNLPPNIVFTFYVTSYNNNGESGASNTETYLWDHYSPPEDVTPVYLGEIPGIPNNPLIEM